MFAGIDAKDTAIGHAPTPRPAGPARATPRHLSFPPAEQPDRSHPIQAEDAHADQKGIQNGSRPVLDDGKEKGIDHGNDQYMNQQRWT
jgi:hypothetical protein